MWYPFLRNKLWLPSNGDTSDGQNKPNFKSRIVALGILIFMPGRILVDVPSAFT
jgi:hypothetical protein